MNVKEQVHLRNVVVVVVLLFVLVQQFLLVCIGGVVVLLCGELHNMVFLFYVLSMELNLLTSCPYKTVETVQRKNTNLKCSLLHHFQHYKQTYLSLR